MNFVYVQDSALFGITRHKSGFASFFKKNCHRVTAVTFFIYKLSYFMRVVELGDGKYLLRFISCFVY